MPRRRTTSPPDPSSVGSRYPHIARWVQDGWIEIGWPGYNLISFVRALDEGGMVWEGAAEYPSLNDALAALNAGIAAFLTGQGL
jgi:hypothetical protein